MKCPNCGFENIDGVDLCDSCGTDIAGLDLPEEQATGEVCRFYDVTLADLKPQAPIAVSGDTTAADAIDLMRKNGHSAVYVVENGRLRGIFTERDVFRRFALAEEDPANVRVRDVMTPEPESLPADATLNSALYLMSVGGYRHIPVVDEEGRPTGFVSIRGVLDFLRTNVVQ